MAKRGHRVNRKPQRLQETAVKLLALGAAFVLGPMFLGGSPWGRALQSITPVGFLLLAAGGVVYWFSTQTDSPDDTARPKPQPRAPMARTATAEPTPEAAIILTATAPTPPARPTSWQQPVLEVIEWRRFEALVEALFQQGGFRTESQSHGPDGGVDIRLYSRHQPGAPVSLVQCKHWKSKRVGVDKVRELRGVLAAEGVPRGQLVCSSAFTPDAVAFAKDNHINLLGAEELLGLIRSNRSPEQQQALLDVALEGEYWKPTCASCGTKMVERVPPGGGRRFWGCANYPKCRNVIQMGER